MKEIWIFGSALGGRQIVKESFTTWGELRKHLESEGMIAGDMKATCRELQMAFDNDSAELPSQRGIDEETNIVTHDFTIFLTARKTKSGN